ncbi:TlpA family protein disulfide reductase [Faecalibacter bovis]|uniref:Redoxin domain-containing protein n=1 Tax=Faecalibacter bovis TaxID=2898187 RepID=A0ABX7XEB5_9FLAO|nr:thioredoxin-like domain-containing protein [Faecalibacter bovis]MBS7333625.1 redoxin domain-containing protein [Weeksellaceae bacterium]QTV06271.1 redoxin domain-containing protein [Faecalibacter bovis]
MKSIFTFLFVACFSVFTFAQTNLPEHEYPSTMPAFQFVKIKGEGIFDSKDLKKNKTTIIGLVSPECIHCLLSLEHLNNNFEKLKDVNIVLVTEYSKEEFYNKINALAPNFYSANNVEILQDSDYEFAEKFKPLTIPTFYLYNKKGELITVKRGSVEVNQIFQFL